MVEITNLALKEKHIKGGRNPKLSFEYILLLMLTYSKDYTTFFKTGLYFDLHESNVYRWVKRYEKIQMAFARAIKVSEIGEKHKYAVDITE